MHSHATTRPGEDSAGQRLGKLGLPSRAYLASIVESSEDAILSKDLDGIVTSWNPAAEQLYGYAPEEIIGRRISLLMPPEQPDEFPSIMARLRRGERIEHYETVRVRKDGARLDISVTISPIRDDSGTIVGASAIARDITARRQAERERAELLRREREAWARTASLQAITAALAGALTLDGVAQIVIEQGLPAVGAAAGAVGLVTDDGQALELVRTVGYPDEMVAALRRMPLTASTPMTEAVRAALPIWREFDTTPAERFADYDRRNHHYPAGVALPLVVGGRVIGAIGMSFSQPRSFSPNDESYLLALAGQCSQAIERVRLYETERAAREQLDAILAGVADGVLVQDRNGRFVYANETAARTAGFASATEYYQADSAEISNRLAILDANGQPFPHEQLPNRRVLRGEPAPEMVVQFRRLDTGETRWSLTRARLIRDARGEPLAISIFHDITDQKRSGQRLRFLAEAGAQLSESLDVESTLAAVVQLATRTLADWALIVLTGDGGEIQHQAVAHRQPAGEAVLRELIRRYPPRPDDDSVFWQAIRRGRSMLVPEVAEPDLLRVAPAPDQLRLLRELRLTSALYLPLVARGRTLGAIGLFTADTERRLTEEDRTVGDEVARRVALALDNARLYHEAQEAIRVRDEFLSIASHEIRTPVAALSGVAQLLQRARRRGLLDEARLDRALEQIAHGSRRLAALTEDLLDVSRLQSGHFELHARILDLVSFTRELVEQYRDRLDEHHTISFTSAPEVCAVAADPVRLEQVLDNLIGNAQKYSPAGGEIEVRLQPDGAGLRLDVSDQGIGLPRGAGDTLFRPFGRTANAVEQQIQGLGLGLYICRQIVERHGGRLWAESPGEDRGTTMHVWLPCARAGETSG